MYDPITFNEKFHNCALSLSQRYVENALESLYRVLTLKAKPTETLIKDGSLLMALTFYIGSSP